MLVVLQAESRQQGGLGSGGPWDREACRVAAKVSSEYQVECVRSIGSRWGHKDGVVKASVATASVIARSAL